MKGLCKILTRAAALWIALLTWSWTALALDPGQWRDRRAPLEGQPVEILADRMELRRQDNLIIYTGNVSVRQPEYKMNSDLLEVRWDPETRKISHLVARGKVRMETEDARATCGMAVLDVAAQAVEMQESPKMVQGGEHVEGEKIVYSLTEKRSTVLGGRGGRVRTLVLPGGKR
jgi:lipopolysaccharide export system protein LptA